MNNSSLYECSIAPKNEKKEYNLYIILKIVKIICLLGGFATAFLAFYLYTPIFIVSAIFFINAIVWGILQTKVYAFYDYIIVDDEIRFVKVINNKRRKILIKFLDKNILKAGFVSSAEFENLYANKDIKKLYAKSKLINSGDFYFYINHNGENKLVILTYNQQFLYYVLKKTTKKILDSEFTKNYEKFNLSWQWRNY